jgi:RNA polymerase sigma-70 factor, ECF subfamily
VTTDLLEASDAVLVIAIGRRNREALAECYRRHGGPALRLAQRLLIDNRLAEEVVQDVFLQLWTNPERFDPERGALRSFLLMKTHGRSVDQMRSEQSRRRRDNADATELGRSGYDLEREVIDVEQAERVQRALASLPEPERRAISLAYFGGHTYKEVAAVLGEPEGTIKSRIRTGLKSLRRQLQDIGDIGMGANFAPGGGW